LRRTRISNNKVVASEEEEEEVLSFPLKYLTGSCFDKNATCFVQVAHRCNYEYRVTLLVVTQSFFDVSEKQSSSLISVQKCP
jgi:hypothetical protein